MPLPSKYNPAYHDDWAWSLAIKGATNDEIAAAFGISVRTFIRWRQQYESLDKAVSQGKEAADAKVEKSLYRRAIGMKVIDTEKVIDVSSEDGTQRPVRIRNTEKSIAPDTMAIMYWLNNRSRKTGEWTHRQEVALSNESEKEDVLIYLPAKEKEKMNEELETLIENTPG